MGGISTQEEIVARLDKLDLEEININKQLRELQIELNGIVPVRDRVKVKSEYFDNISTGELGKNKENKENKDKNNNKKEKIEESSDENSSRFKKKKEKEKLKTTGEYKKKSKKSKKKKK